MSIQLKTVLIVDDTPQNLDVLAGILRKHYKVRVALNGDKALKIANSESKPDLILLDIMMPGMDGHEVCKQLKRNPLTAHIPTIFVTAKSEALDVEVGFELGAVDYIVKPFNPTIVLARVKTHLSLYDQSCHLEALVNERTSEIKDSRLEIIRRLALAAELKNNEADSHILRVSWFAKCIAEELGMDDKWCELLFNATPLHDVGNAGIPGDLFLKAGPLDEDEWSIIKRHTEYGAKIIGDNSSPLMAMAKEITLSHHEKWDGSGYPKGLSEANIPLAARIVAIADVFDAMMTVKPYRKAWSEDDAVTFIKEQSGRHFDPDLVITFLACLDTVRNIQKQYPYIQ